MIDQKIWNVLRPEIRWVAMDESGKWWGFSDQPKQVMRSCWSKDGLLARLDDTIALPKVVDWRESLYERPPGPEAERPYVVDDAHRAYANAILPSMIASWRVDASTLSEMVTATHALARALREAEKTA